MATVAEQLNREIAKIRAEKRAAENRNVCNEIENLKADRLHKATDWRRFNALRFPDAIRSLVRGAQAAGMLHDFNVQTNDLDVTRQGFSTPIIVSAFSTEAGSRVAAGYSAIRDTTAGLTTEIPAPTFRESELYAIEETTRLKRMSKGREADHATFVAAPTPRSLARYAAQIVADEQSIIDSLATGGAWLEGFTELGRAARRLYLDLVWSTVLNNPTCYDAVAMFNSAHGNLMTGGGSALSGSSLAAACQKIAGQAFVGDDGAPVHGSLRPTTLVVPPALDVSGRDLLRARMLDNDEDNLSIVVENRVSAAGCENPTDGSVVVGSDMLWFLAASSDQRPAVVVSFLEGSSTSPTVETFSLDRNGLWGQGWAVKLDIGCAVIDWRSWVSSSGD